MAWKSPYVDRLRYTLTAFLQLAKDFQGLIISAAEDGIFWRGDTKEFFLAVLGEHDMMKQDPDYRGKAMQKMRRYAGSIKP